MQNGIVLDFQSFWQSKLGRFLFLTHLILGMAIIGCLWNHLGQGYFLFAGENRLLFLLDWPQLSSLRVPQTRTFVPFTWQANRFSDALQMIVISLPWWGYGYFAEVVAPVIRRGLGNQSKISPHHSVSLTKRS